jgi:hypothetical protein
VGGGRWAVGGGRWAVAMGLDQHRQGDGNATMVSPPRWQGRGETARQGHPSMIDTCGMRGEGLHWRRRLK